MHKHTFTKPHAPLRIYPFCFLVPATNGMVPFNIQKPLSFMLLASGLKFLRTATLFDFIPSVDVSVPTRLYRLPNHGRKAAEDRGLFPP